MRSHPVAQEKGIRACSACSGDYEDPEQAVGNEASEEEDAEKTAAENAEQSVAREGFPVRDK